MIREILNINEELCDGCGECVVDCAEGAIQIIDGKAQLVKEQFCDGFGDCVGACPTGALTIEKRDVEDFDKDAVKEHLLQSQGVEAVWRMEDAHKRHMSKKEDNAMSSGCPGSRTREINIQNTKQPVASGAMPQVNPSELQQWPIQLHLVHPAAPFFKNKELVVMNTCGPLASADVHWRYLRGRSVVVGCPKLDDTSNYAMKMGEILKESTIPKVIVVRMEVPCCGGLTMIATQAVQFSGRTDIVLEEHILGLDGAVMNTRAVNTQPSEQSVGM